MNIVNGKCETIYTPQKIAEICDLYRKYIENATIPIVKEFSYINKIPLATLYEIPEFRELTHLCTQRKEVVLEKGMLSGELNSTGSIFSLKQLGWKDKQEHDLGDSVINVNIVK